MHDYTSPVHISIVLIVDVPQKSLYFRPVDNDLHSDRAIGNCTRNATSCI